MGDIDRTSQQQVFIKALAKEVLQAKTIPKLPKLIKDLNKYVETNMKTTDMLRIASWAPGFNTDSIIAQTLPGAFYDEVDENGYLLNSYWQVDKQQVAKLLETMFNGDTVAVVQNSIQKVIPTQNSSDNDSTEDEEPDNVVDKQDKKDKNENQEVDEDKETTRDREDDEDQEEQEGPPAPDQEIPSDTEPTTPGDITGPEGYI
jgi:anionic cell wall polymer biosynthesis LytR-Cps2A-Psr (LCP) family protein